MKKIYFLLVLWTATALPVPATESLDPELEAALPSGQYFLPGPPEIGSLVWQDDSVKYFEYRQALHKYDTVRQEYWDSVWAIMNEPYYFALYRVGADSVMDAPFISQLSWTKSPQGAYSVTYTRNLTDFPQMNALQELCEAMKEANTSGLWRTRARPYKYFGEWYKGRHYTENRNDATSYPSGHGYFAGLFGMCLLYIDPDNALAIKNMLDEWVNCRLTLGAHWNTDIDAGKQLGAMAFAIAMHYDQFRNQVLAAKAELQNYRATLPQPTGNEQAPASPAVSDGKRMVNGQLLIEHDGRTYDAQGALLR